MNQTFFDKLNRSKTFLFFIALSMLSGVPGSTKPDSSLLAFNKQKNGSVKLQIADYKKQYPCQSIAHLGNTAIRDAIIDEDCVQKNINRIGKKRLEKIVNKALRKEAKLSDNYYPFYHGTRLEFLFLQDLFEKLYEISFQKTLSDFVMLRIPSKESKIFRNIKQFIKKFSSNICDHVEPQRSLLLSVNFFLFGNTSHSCWGESTFHYWTSSSSALSVDFENRINDILRYFCVDKQKLQRKYREKVESIIRLLSSFERRKTGVLVQVFIHKDIVNELVYQSLPLGNPVYKTKYIINQYVTPISEELDQYKKACFSEKRVLEKFFFGFSKQNNNDMWQGRILMNDLMVNPKRYESEIGNKIKIFRYYNKETDSVRRYKQKFKKLISELEKDISSNKKRFKYLGKLGGINSFVNNFKLLYQNMKNLPLGLLGPIKIL